MQQRIAIIRLQGKIGVKKKIRDTFNLLRLYKKYSCVVVPNTKPYVGMITKLKDYITWGEIDESTLKLLLEKRGRLPGKQSLTDKYIKEKIKIDIPQFSKEIFEFKKDFKDLPGLKPFFKLAPPRFGFENKGTKRPYSLGGSLGYRKNKINELIQRMV